MRPKQIRIDVDVGQEAINHYNATVIPVNIESPRTAVDNINAIAYKMFTENDEYKKMSVTDKLLADKYFHANV